MTVAYVYRLFRDYFSHGALVESTAVAATCERLFLAGCGRL